MKKKYTICQRCGAKIEGVVSVCPYCGADIIKTPFYKKKWFAILVGVIIVGMVLSMCGHKGSSSEKEYTEITWPDSEIGEQLPETEARASSFNYNDSYIMADLKMSKGEYNEYVSACKDKGFTKDLSTSDYGDSGRFSAKNKKGYSLSLSWYEDDGECSLSIYAPADDESDDESDEDKDSKKSKKSKKKAADNSGDGVTPEFKEAMDEYEEFFDKYAEFMKKYGDGSGDLTEYAEMMAQYSTTMEKLDEIDEDSLSDADEAYYLEVMARINQKLAEVA